MNNNSTTKNVIINIEVDNKDAINNIIAARTEIDKLKEQQKELESQGKKNSVEWTKNAETIKSLNAVVRANSKAVQDNIDLNKANEGSLKQMRAEVKRLNAQYAELSKSERESASGVELKDKIAGLTTELKDLEHVIGDDTRTVGNYASVWDALDAPTGNARTRLRELIIEIQNTAVSLTSAEGAISGQKQVVESLAQSIGVESQAYQDALNKLNSMTKAYEESKQKMAEMEQKAGEMRDTISDVNTRINSFANDEQKIIAAQQGVQVLTGAYTVLQTSLKALGVEQKSLLEVYAKVQLVQQSLNSLLAVYKALNKDSNLMVVLRTKLEQTRLAYTQAYNAALKEQNAEIITNTAAQETNNVAITTSTGAAEGATAAHFSLKAAINGVGAAIKANPIGAAILAITVAVTGLTKAMKQLEKVTQNTEDSLKKHAQELKESQQSYATSIENAANAQSSLTRKYDEQIAKVKILYGVIKNEAATYNEKLRAMNELNRLVPEYNGNISKTGKIISENVSALDKYIKKLEEEARMEAVKGLLVEDYMEQARLKRQQQQIIQDAKKAKKAVNEAQAAVDLDLPIGHTSRKEEQKRELAAAQEELNKYVKTYDEIGRKLKGIDERIKMTLSQVDSTSGLISQTSDESNGQNEKPVDDMAASYRKQYDEILKFTEEFYENVDSLCEKSITNRTEQETKRYEAEITQIQEEIEKAEKLIGQVGVNPDSLNELIKNLKNALEVAKIEHKKNINDIKRETDESFVALTDRLTYENSLYNANAIDELRLKLKADLAALEEEERMQLDSHEYTEEQKLEITRLYANKREAMVKREKQEEVKVWSDATIAMAKSIGNAMGSLADLFNVVAQDNEEMADFATAMALAQIAISTAISIANAVQGASAAGAATGMAAPITTPIFIAELVAIVASALASATSTLLQAKQSKPSAPKFATGGLINRGQDGVDKVPIMATKGEYVIRKKKVDELGVDFLDMLNFGNLRPDVMKTHYAQGGLVNAPSNSTLNDVMRQQDMVDVMREVMSEIQPVVSVKEITRAQSRVRVKQA